MNDSEFIDLLNLYLDHEISAVDAARLEAEVQRDPERQKIYRQYCRMQKACKLLTADFKPETAAASSGKVVAFSHEAATAAPRHNTGGFYTFGAVAAAAACVAIIFIGRNRQASAESSETFAAVPTPQVAPALVADTTGSSRAEADVPVSIVAAASPALNTSGPQSLGTLNRATLVANPLLLTGSSQADAVLAAAIEQANSQFAWMQNVQLTPLQQPSSNHSLRFEAQSVSWRQERRTLDNRAAPSGATEMSAFQFMK